MNDNIISLVPKSGDGEDRLPQNNYLIIDVDGYEYEGVGFVIFTTHHVAIMRDDGKGAVPVVVVPLGRVRCCEIIDDEVEDELPFN